MGGEKWPGFSCPIGVRTLRVSAERICDRLRDAFGTDSVFKDVDSIIPASRWRDELDQQINACRILVVVIGTRWAGERDADGRRRLADPEDFVRREVSAALNRGIPLLPLLVDEAEVPDQDDIPGDLRGLLDYQMSRVRRDPDFRTDMERVIRAIRLTLGLPEPEAAGRKTASQLVAPRSLRAFDTEDADVFLDLLPGARGSDGLPESLSFWKHWMERARGGGRTRGPALWPQRGGQDLAGPGGTPAEARRLDPPGVPRGEGRGDRGRPGEGVARSVPNGAEAAPGSGPEASLRAAAQAVSSASRTLLVVIDQLEQWLHALDPGDDDPDLARVLDCCDGRSAMALLLVRDDYAIEAGRRLRVRLDFRDNCARLEPFSRGHARSVLEAFGRGCGQWPAPPTPLPEDAGAFLDQVVDELAEEGSGRIVAVRIALFVEMIKDRPWNLAALDGIGGARGVGVAFLEQKFSDPLRRGHRRAAEAVLRALLPAAGLAVKGRMRPRAELLEQSGLSGRPDAFDALLRTLDDDLRLITPTYPDAAEPGPAPGGGERFYQLTHDYLVEPIREWIARDEMSTWSGRISARLRETADAWWAHRRDPRFLPYPLELASYSLGSVSHRTEAQKLMVRAAWQFYRVRLLQVAAVVVPLSILIVWGILWFVVWPSWASTLINDYLSERDPAAAAKMVPSMEPYKDLIIPVFSRQLGEGHPEEEWAEEQGPRIVAALIRLHEPGAASVALRNDVDHRAVRTATIHKLAELSDLSKTGKELLDRLDNEPDAGVRRALTLALGKFDRSRFPDKGRLEAGLCRLSETDPDPGVRSAAESAHRALGIASSCGPRGGRADDGRSIVTADEAKAERPLVTAEGQTLVVLEHKAPRRFAIATTEVTQEEFEHFVHDIAGRPGISPIKWSRNREFADRAHPSLQPQLVRGDGLLRLAQREKMGPGQICFEASRGVDAIQAILGADPEIGGKSARPAIVLDREGYRLPTVDEWEYCCRHGGNVVPAKYLKEYENYTYDQTLPNNLCRPVGSLMPNELGLFDLLGNVYEWSLEWRPAEADSPFPMSPAQPPTEKPSFLGGSHYTMVNALGCGAPSKHSSGPSERHQDVGFRIARSLPGAVAGPRRVHDTGSCAGAMDRSPTTGRDPNSGAIRRISWSPSEEI